MKKVLLFCVGLLSVVLFVTAGQQVPDENSRVGENAIGNSLSSEPSKDTPVESAPSIVETTLDETTAEIAETDEIAILSARIADLKAPGLELPASLFARLAELEEAAAGRPDPGSPLDQGGETCELATVIEASENVNYCVTGTMGATRECVPPTGVDPAYRDVFYVFTPTVTGTYVVSMCNSVGDVVYNIYEATCCAAAIFGNADDECGASDPIAVWSFAAGTTYYIQCGYYSSSQVAAAYNFSLIGPFDLSQPANDACAGALSVAVPSTTPGNTLGATNDTTQSCGPTSYGYGSVWYTVTGNGDSLRARVTLGTCYYFMPRIRVFRGFCGDLACVGGAGTGVAGGTVTFTWCSVPDVTYYIVVSSYNSSPTNRGPFALEIIDSSLPCTTPAWPENEYCNTATLVDVPSQTNGTLLNAALDLVPSCNAVIASYPGVWYKVIGNDHFITATTCNDVTGFDTRLSVYTGSCGSFVCVTANNNDANCTVGPGTPGNKSTVLWCSDLGVEYFILVHSNVTTGYGAFRLDILDGLPCHLDCETYYPCAEPVEVEPNNMCADAANFVPLVCGDAGASAYYYGTICPQSDLDYYYVPGVALGQILRIKLYEGDNCSIYPPVGLVMRGATAVDGSCAAATGANTVAYQFGTNCAPYAGGYIAVVRNSGFEQKYKLEVSCSTAVLPVCPDVQLPNQYCAGPCVGAIGTDYAWHVFPLEIPLTEVIVDLNVRVNIEHTYDGDIDMWVVTPWGDSIELSTDNGGTGENFQNTVFDDEAACLISNTVCANPPYAGSFIPEELLAGVNGYAANGIWQLAIYDDAGGDHGYVNCWCLEFESLPPCTPTELVMFTRHPIPQYACAELCANVVTYLQVCPDPGTPPLGPDKPPIVTVTAGCFENGCNQECTAAEFIYSSTAWLYNELTGCWENTVTGVTSGCVCVALEGFLAVELNSFTATTGDGSVTLLWSTRAEPDNDYFEILRDGSKVAELDAHGSVTSGAEYSWTDSDLINGTPYTYTLVAVDINGHRGTLETLSATPNANVVLITEYALHQNYPNPFNPTTSIMFDVLEDGFVTLRVYNMIGQEVATLVNSQLSHGRHLVSFDATNLTSGLYLYRMEVNGFTAMNKMLLIK